MKIAIIGSNGFLGSKLVEFFSKENEVISATLHPHGNEVKLDATNKEEVSKFILKFNPEIVIDTVALSSSVKCEKNPEECKRINYLTAKNLSESCMKCKSTLIFISSSYVFNGEKGNYTEDDETSPENEYAKMKVLAEEQVSKDPKNLVIRLDMLYGEDNGKLKFGTRYLDNLSEIDLGYPNQIRSPIWVEDVPRIINELIKKRQKGIFHVAGPDKITMENLLKELIEITDRRIKINRIDVSNWIVKSPSNSSLNISKIKSFGISPVSFESSLSKIKTQI